MLARDMRRAQLAEAAIYGAIAWWLRAQDVPLALCVAAIPALFVLTRCLIVGGMFVLAAIHAAPREPEERIGIGGAIAMMVREQGAFLALSLYRTPWEDLAVRSDPPPDAPGERAVILVHGYFANRGCWAPLVRRLEAAGVAPLYVSSCPSHFATIEAYEEELNAVIERVARGRRVVLVAHSMGGLVARLHLARRGSSHVAKLVTIGSPHRGTELARWGVGPNAREMVPGSAFLARLEERERSAPLPPTLAIYSLHDNMIQPQTAGRLEGARNVAVRGVGHVSQFGDAQIARLVIEALRAP